MNNVIDKQAMKDKQTVEKFRKNVKLLKKTIVKSVKHINQLIKDADHAKSENDRKAVMEKIRKMHHIVACYRTVLDDLAYAFMDYNKGNASMRIARRFGYKTVEGYLADKKNDNVMPRLSTVIELIANHYGDITRFYKFDYTGPKVQVIRNHQLIDGTNDYLLYSRNSNVRRIPATPHYVSDYSRTISSSSESAAKHR